MKFVMEVLFVAIFMKLSIKEFKEIRSRKFRLVVLSIWTKGHESLRTKGNFWMRAIREHYVNGDEPISNLIDLLQVLFSISLCVVWLHFIREVACAERALVGLHRPVGVVNYDDNSLDEWSIYHRNVDYVDSSVQTAIYDMVNSYYLISFT
jgi:hypothetical protein